MKLLVASACSRTGPIRGSLAISRNRMTCVPQNRVAAATIDRS